MVGKSLDEWRATSSYHVDGTICVPGENKSKYYATLQNMPRRNMERWLTYTDHAYFDTPFRHYGIDLVIN